MARSSASCVPIWRRLQGLCPQTAGFPIQPGSRSQPASALTSNESDPRSRYDAMRLDAPKPLSDGYADAGIFPLVDVVKKHFKGVISDAGFHEQEAVLDMSGVDDTIAPVHLAQFTLDGT